MSSIIPRLDDLHHGPLAGDLADCMDQLDEIDTDAKGLVAGLSEEQFHWSPVASRWSIAQCLVHLVIVGRIYLPILDETIEQGRADDLTARGPYHYGFIERWFVNSTEPPPSIRLRTPAAARPPDDHPIEQVVAQFRAVQEELRQRIRAANGLDLARVKVTSPFVRALKMGLGSCFLFLAAHERRHLWQAWQVRRDARFPKEEEMAPKQEEASPAQLDTEPRQEETPPGQAPPATTFRQPADSGETKLGETL